MTTSFTRRDGRYYRAGLVYEPEEVCDEEVLYYEPDGPFFVDGIRYEAPVHSDFGVYTRPMIEVLADGGGDAAYRHEPMSDTDLDKWVRHGQ